MLSLLGRKSQERRAPPAQCWSNKRFLMVSPIPLPVSCFQSKCLQRAGAAFLPAQLPAPWAGSFRPGSVCKRKTILPACPSPQRSSWVTTAAVPWQTWQGLGAKLGEVELRFRETSHQVIAAVVKLLLWGRGAVPAPCLAQRLPRAGARGARGHAQRSQRSVPWRRHEHQEGLTGGSIIGVDVWEEPSCLGGHREAGLGLAGLFGNF